MHKLDLQPLRPTPQEQNQTLETRRRWEWQTMSLSDRPGNGHSRRHRLSISLHLQHDLHRRPTYPDAKLELELGTDLAYGLCVYWRVDGFVSSNSSPTFRDWDTDLASSVMHAIIAIKNLHAYIRYQDSGRCTRCHQVIGVALPHSDDGLDTPPTRPRQSLSPNSVGTDEEDMLVMKT